MTFSVDLGLVGVFVGLIGIGLTILLSIRPELGRVTTAVQEASKDLAAVRQKIDAIWDITLQRSGGAGSGATVILRLEHLGEVKISARPGSENTEYVVQTEKGIVRSDLIVRLSKTTGLEAKEMEMFAGKLPLVFDLAPGRLLVRLPSTDAGLCTEYIRELVYWLDSAYWDAADKEIERYEKPILNGDEALKQP